MSEIVKIGTDYRLTLPRSIRNREGIFEGDLVILEARKAIIENMEVK